MSQIQVNTASKQSMLCQATTRIKRGEKLKLNRKIATITRTETLKK